MFHLQHPESSFLHFFLAFSPEPVCREQLNGHLSLGLSWQHPPFHLQQLYGFLHSDLPKLAHDIVGEKDGVEDGFDDWDGLGDGCADGIDAIDGVIDGFEEGFEEGWDDFDGASVKSEPDLSNLVGAFDGFNDFVKGYVGIGDGLDDEEGVRDGMDDGLDD